MTPKTILADVQWALQGKTLGRGGARVLACSDGNLSQENFTELIGRFSLGTPGELPQVSVSYLNAGAPPSDSYYLGMALHKWAADVRTDGGDLLERDDDNRPVAVTAYFCVPYQPLADAAVSYQAMYGAFDNMRLGMTGGPPLPVEFPVRTGLPPIDDLAMQAAGRLLANRPVCVLGAESATVTERLEFIGAVAALLPYGFRTRLTAATWVRPTHRAHRFRLYFSDAKRDHDPPDDAVYWGRPDLTELTPDLDYAWEYDLWLTQTVGQLGILAGLTAPRSFNREDVLKSLDDIGLESSRPAEKQVEKQAEKRSGEETQPKPELREHLRKPRWAKHDVGPILHKCAGYLEERDVAGLKVAVTRLEGRAESRSRISDDEQHYYQEIIKERRLFRFDEEMRNTVASLREALFKVAFSQKLTYLDYCLIEESADVGDAPPDQALLRLIVDTGLADLQIGSLVNAQLMRLDEREDELNGWYEAAGVTINQLIDVMTGTWNRPHHAIYVSVITAFFMRRKRCEPSLIREVLQQHGYLADLFRPGGDYHDQNHVFVLYYFLKAAYPGGFGRSDIRQILIGSPEPPSAVLLAAILRYLTGHEEFISHEKVELAREAQLAYASRAILGLNLMPETGADMRKCLTGANGWPPGWAELLPRPRADPSGSES